MSFFGRGEIAGGLLFLSSCAFSIATRRCCSRAIPKKLVAERLSCNEIIAKIESRIQRDEGNRGIGCLIIPNELSIAANDCLKARNIVIITGFPCLVDFTPPTETDGPLGALAIARSLLSLGNNQVSILTDECNEDVMLAAAAASGLCEKYNHRFQLESFPALPTFDESDQKRLDKIADSTDLLIAIERAGPSKDGTYLTMRAIDMSSIVAPLDDIITRRALNQESDIATLRSDRTFRSIGIGDGGNEVGMGKVFDKIVSSTIPRAEIIGCVVPTDSLIVSSVSNWGGYALAAAIVVQACLSENRIFSEHELEIKLSEGLVSSETEVTICERMIRAGARDGITKKQELMVDGFPLSSSLEVLEDIRRLASGISGML